jgi:bifunctional UDP-N-acetylglucosamine pyrophosphorylase/glucosamine-1-phosphate N-acetyltransferase
MLQHLIDTVEGIPKSKTSVIVGYKSNEVESGIYSSKKINFIKQKKQLGTAHAVKQALPYLRKNAISIILYGDAPLVAKNTLNKLIRSASKGDLCLLSFIKEDPTGYGRIMRGPRGSIKKIVEHKDATTQERSIKEVNSGIMAVKSDLLQ